MNHQYKVGDRVRIISTDYPEIVPLNSIQTIIDKNDKGCYFISGERLTSWGEGWTFYERELEPYKEEVMNDKIEVGDVLNTTGTHTGSSYDIVESIDGNSLTLSVTGSWDLDKSIARIREGKWKLVSKGNKMKEVIGYNIKPEFKSKSAAIAKAINGYDNSSTPFMPFSGIIPDNARTLNVLDLWFEPVYKSSEVVVKLSGNRTATLKDKQQATITLADGTKTSVTALNVEYTLKAFGLLGQIAGYNVAIKKFQLGCQTFTIKDLEAVNQAFTDFQ